MEFRKLNFSPAPRIGNPFDQKSLPQSVREWEVMRMVAKATRISSDEDRRNFLEREVTRIYRLKDYHVAQDFVSRVNGLIEGS